MKNLKKIISILGVLSIGTIGILFMAGCHIHIVASILLLLVSLVSGGIFVYDSLTQCKIHKNDEEYNAALAELDQKKKELTELNGILIKRISKVEKERAELKKEGEILEQEQANFKTEKENFEQEKEKTYDDIAKENGIFRFYGKHFSNEVDKERGNYDYLMGCDVDFNNIDVVDDLNQWGKWFLSQTNVDGFRLDAIKHIRSSFYKKWLADMKSFSNKDLFTVGEYFSVNIDSLINYLDYNDQVDTLFDVPLHDHFKIASESGGHYDMSKIFEDTLVDRRPSKAVTFVDNHDTEPGQSLESWVQEWFKPLAYSMIMFREKGTPCIFYGDYYGIPEKNIEPMKELLDVFLLARKYLAYGYQKDYIDNENIIGWTREGDYYHQDSGMAVLISDGPGGSKQMNVGPNLANSILYDCTGNVKETVYVDKEGNGIFYVNGGSVSVWIKKDNMYNL